MDRNRLSVKMKTFIAMVFGVCASLALFTGVGMTTVIQKITNSPEEVPYIRSNFQAEKGMFVETETFNPPLLKVEVIRDGQIICTRSETPSISESSKFIEYAVNRPISGCPDVKRGDSIKATWTFHNELKLSSYAIKGKK